MSQNITWRVSSSGGECALPKVRNQQIYLYWLHIVNLNWYNPSRIKSGNTTSLYLQDRLGVQHWKHEWQRLSEPFRQLPWVNMNNWEWVRKVHQQSSEQSLFMITHYISIWNHQYDQHQATPRDMGQVSPLWPSQFAMTMIQLLGCDHSLVGGLSQGP